jgi:hypothetical protein
VFRTDIVAIQSGASRIHVNADNLSAQKTERVKESMAAHPNVHLNSTPTDSPLLSRVELWLAKIERDVIVRGVFTTVTDRERKPVRYIRQYSKNAKPVARKYYDPSLRTTPDSIATIHQGVAYPVTAGCGQGKNAMKRGVR